MITRGQITKIISQTKAEVLLSLFSTPEMPVKPVQCEICYSPGVYDAYRVSDFVYVSFIENQLGQPIILGRIYSDEKENESPQQPRGFMNPQTFSPGTSVDLPLSTKIGSVSGYEIEKAVSNSLLKEDKSIDLQNSGSNIPVTAVCLDVKAGFNLYRKCAEELGFTADDQGNFLRISFLGDPKLTPQQIQDYTYFMTGVRFMPPKGDNSGYPEDPMSYHGALIQKTDMSV